MKRFINIDQLWMGRHFVWGHLVMCMSKIKMVSKKFLSSFYLLRSWFLGIKYFWVRELSFNGYGNRGYWAQKLKLLGIIFLTKDIFWVQGNMIFSRRFYEKQSKYSVCMIHFWLIRGKSQMLRDALLKCSLLCNNCHFTSYRKW